MNDRKKKILLLYTSVGLGHKSIAENIGYHLEQNNFEVHLADITKVQNGKLVTWGTRIHQLVNTRMPWLWNFLYKHGYKLFSALRIPLASRNYQATKKLVDTFSPDAIITTQTSASAVVSFLKSKKLYNGLFVAAFSDYHFHPYWEYPNVDLYIVNIEEQRVALMNRGVPAEKISVCGITLMPKRFFEEKNVRSLLRINPSDELVVISSGSLGTMLDLSWLLELIRQLLVRQSIRIVVVTGKNQALHNQLLMQQLSPRVRVVGFYKPMGELYTLASLYVTKPGGLSIAESLQYGVPVMVTHCLPGQELLNYRFLLAHNLVMSGMSETGPDDPAKIAQKIMQELDKKSFKISLKANSLRVKLLNDRSDQNLVILALKRAFHNDERR